uniref:Chitin-binding type-4 domain-containing protein n=1 Tax=Grammatophora oceanica TaxID=210454 RepID=A0A7S1Y7U5_9STRA|mmetsp:Transcript_2907/g.3975  ORF Transcript_2907/g.3975 Transcript_2907/m.3975 type:complete len:536 (+) Transcript_2907:126-1733(+)
MIALVTWQGIGHFRTELASPTSLNFIKYRNRLHHLLVMKISIQLLLLASATTVHGHGYLATPRARQVVAAADGVGSSNDPNAGSLPPRDTCPHCSLIGGQTYGVCGVSVSDLDRDYTFGWDTAAGTPMPWNSEATYEEGGLIEVETVLQTNHGGHIVVGVCADYENPTQACFDANRLEFVEDALYGAPKDINYPDRGYLAPQTSAAQWNPDVSPLVSIQDDINVGGQLCRHIFRLPTGVTGDKVLLQWQWISNLGCRSPGYDVYPFPPGWEPYGNAGDVCTLPMPDIGNAPQHYWQCSEITILSSGPTASIAPAAPATADPTAAPVTASPVSCNIETEGCCSTGPDGCPSWDSPCFTFENCGKTQECQWTVQMKWIGCEDSPVATPSPVDQVTPPPTVAVTPDPTTGPTEATPSPIAPTATPVEATPSPTSAPTVHYSTPAPIVPVPPTMAPADAAGCCTQNFKECITWCGSTEAECDTCSSSGVYWAPNGMSGDSCIARWQQCAHDFGGCCNGLQCIGNQWGAQCKVVDEPFWT